MTKNVIEVILFLDKHSGNLWNVQPTRRYIGNDPEAIITSVSIRWSEGTVPPDEIQIKVETN